MTWSPEVAMSKGEIDNFLNQKLVARLASIKKDSSVHITPLWYLWEGGTLYFTLGAGLRPRQHISNLKRDSRASVIIDRDIRPEVGSIEPGAQAVLIRGRAELSSDVNLQEEYVRKLWVKYFGTSPSGKDLEEDLADGRPGKNRVIAKIKPYKIIAWDFTKLKS